MNGPKESYDGALISELGVKRYLNGVRDQKWSNVNLFLRGEAAKQAWEECNFGCHGPTYRSLRRPSTFSEALKPIDTLSPVLAGAIDGVRHQTIGKAQRVAAGINRTGEGLMLSGEEAFAQVGDENIAAYQFAVGAFEKMVSFEINVLDNPIAQVVMAVVSEYISVLPEWAVKEGYEQGAFKVPERVDMQWLLKALSLGITKGVDRKDIERAADLLNRPAQRLAGKQIGKKVAAALGAILSVYVCKKLLTGVSNHYATRRRLARLRDNARKLGGGLGGSVLFLLHSQGLLSIAAGSSRRLHEANPKVWSTLRFRLNGANMVYFLVENLLQEYVDRLSLLEKRPHEFAKVMKALLAAGDTREIFFPGTSN